MVKYFNLSVIILILICIHTFAQPKSDLNSAEIKLALVKLDVLGSVLYIAAHPDDENTAAISYFTKGMKLRTGYLALTRGDGGQNLIGPEQGEQLGVIRTQELLEARKRDGGEQFFTRAIDFGYTKSPTETFEFWDKEKILSDVVWVIRKFRPDVIITRFPPTGEGGHGHHTASAILASEAFDLAGKSDAFPEQLKFVKTWQPKRILWNAWLPALQNQKAETSGIISLNLGEFNPLLGKSYTEISALSRSMHKSQGFGASGVRNDLINYFKLLKGDSVSTEMFEGIDLSWKHVDEGNEIHELIKSASKNFDYENPAASLDNLFSIYEKIKSIKDEYWKEVKLKEITEIIRSCAGIWIEAITNDQYVAVGDTLQVKTSIINRSNSELSLSKIDLNFLDKASEFSEPLKKGESISNSFKLYIPATTEISQPYWLKNTHGIGMFEIKDQQHAGLPEEESKLQCTFTVSYKNHSIDFTIPIYNRMTDPVDGEVYKPVIITPPLTINIEKDIYFFSSNDPKEIKVTVQVFKNDLSGKLIFESDNGWKAEPNKYEFKLSSKNQKKEFYVKIIPSANNSNSYLKVKAQIGNETYSKSITRIEYKHFLPQTIFYDTEAKLESFAFQKDGIRKIGYITGSGDKIPEFLTDLGFDITLMNEKHFNANDINQYDVIITGIRAYNTQENLAVFQKDLNRYVEHGGTLVSQYNTSGNLLSQPGVIPLQLSRDRVTDENSAVDILDVNNQIFNKPFKISKKDFENWIQERGLYFPSEWDSKYIPLLSMNDKGESPKQGSLLVTKYGKGTFVYTSLSFFRQIPVGVEGAIKLFINLLYSNR